MKPKPTHKANNLRHSLKNSSNNVTQAIHDAITNIFHGDKLKSIARETKFVQRSSSRLEGNEFVQSMVLASVDPRSTPLCGINDNLRAISSKAFMTSSALRQRINNVAAQEFLKTVYKRVVEAQLKQLSLKINSQICERTAGALRHFSKVLVHDSSTCELQEALEKHFKGSSGSASKSQVKIDLIYDVKMNDVVESIITDLTQPDQGLSKEILKHASKDVLVIQDLGYFDTSVLEGIEKRQGYYLSRLKNGIHVYLNKEDSKPVELGSHLEREWKKEGYIDIEVYISDKKIKTRLVAYPVPEEVFNKRRRDFNRKHGKKTASNETISRQRFTILITNVPQELWLHQVVGTVYKIRWQIELVFKSWKSQLNIQHLRGTKPERIFCLLYSRLIAAALIFTVHSGIGRVLCTLDLELSLYKFVNWLKRLGRFVTIITKGFCTGLWEQLVSELSMVCKDKKRKRKTTRQLLNDEVSFLEIFNFPKVAHA